MVPDERCAISEEKKGRARRGFDEIVAIIVKINLMVFVFCVLIYFSLIL